MTETATRAQIDEYLDRLRAALAPLDEEKRTQLITDITEHINESLASITDPTESDVRNLLDRIGSPQDIAAEATDTELVQIPVKASSFQENLAIALLLVGGILLVVGWIVGVVLLWTSSVWRLRDKLIGTFLLPGGLLPALILVGRGSSESSSTSCTGPPTHCTTTSTHSGLAAPLGVALLIAGLVIPVITAVYLARRRRALMTAAVKPMTKAQWIVVGVGGTLLVVGLAVFLTLSLVTTSTPTLPSQGAAVSGTVFPSTFCTEPTAQCAASNLAGATASSSGFAPDVASPASRSWFSRNSGVIIAMLADTPTFTTIPSSKDFARIHVQCSALRTTLSRAESLPAIPDAAAQTKWAGILSNLSSAATSCITGLNQDNPSLLATVPGEVHSANTLFGLMVFGSPLPSGSGSSSSSISEPIG